MSAPQIALLRLMVQAVNTVALALGKATGRMVAVLGLLLYIVFAYTTTP